MIPQIVTPTTGTGNPALLDLLAPTPVLRIGTPARGYWAKLESHGAGGMKVRAALSMLRGARTRGELPPGGTVVESTSGTLGIGLLYAGQALGHDVVLVVDADIEPAMRALLTAHGARLEVVASPHPEGGWQRARLDRVHELLAAIPGAYWPDQYDNPDNPAGYDALADELAGQVPDLDVLVCSVGTGGHSAGIGRRLRRTRPDLRVLGVDTIGSTIFGQPARPRLMRGLGSSIHPRNVDHDVFDEVHWVGPSEAADTCRRLARSSFVTGGWSTGAAARVADWVARREPGAVVATVFPDGPHRYLGTIFDDAWCRERLPAPPARLPVEIHHPEAVEVVGGWARCRHVVVPRGARVGPEEVSA